jgi:hypothetical protein
MTVPDFKDIVLQASLSLSKDEACHLAYLYRLPYKFLECERPLEILIQLEIMQIITENNPETLAKAFERIKRKDLAKMVRQMKKSSEKSTNNKRKVPLDEDLDKMLLIELCTIKMEMAHAERRLKAFRNSMETRNGQALSPLDAIDLQNSIKDCSNIKQRLNKMQLRNFAGKEDSVLNSSSDEEISPSSTMTRTPAGAFPVLPLMNIDMPELQNRIQQQVDVDYEDQTGSGDDSGFTDARPFLRRPLEEVGDEEQNKENIYDNVYDVVSSSGYMRLRQREMTESEYQYTTCTLPRPLGQPSSYQLEGADDDKLEDDKVYASIPAVIK